MAVHEKLKEIQTMLKAPKNLYNSYGGFSYRNAEGIYEAVKPLLNQLNMTLIINDSVQNVGTKNYIKATAYLTDCETGEQLFSCALAREAETKKGMDDSQITGTASSYARKYALNGLFLLDDTKDEDSDECRKYKENKSKAEPVEPTQPAAFKPATAQQIHKILGSCFCYCQSFDYLANKHMKVGISVKGPAPCISDCLDFELVITLDFFVLCLGFFTLVDVKCHP